MSLMDWLRKLGIIRFGVTKAIYHSAKDRPAEFMMDGVMNAEKDLVGQKPKDTKKASQAD